jgi:hypothetical protein
LNTLYCLEERRGKQIISPPGDNFTPREQNSAPRQIAEKPICGIFAENIAPNFAGNFIYGIADLPIFYLPKSSVRTLI